MAGLVVLASAGLLVACSPDPAPSGVTVGWVKGERVVRVSWEDSGQPNRVSIEGVVSASPSYVKYLGKDAPNTWDIPVAAFPPDGNYRIAVAIGTTTGGVTSKAARSPMFDTDGPARPGDAKAAPVGDNAVLVNWTVGKVPQDFSPNDPLDVKSRTQQYLPVVGRPDGPLQNALPATTSKQRLLRGLKPPFQFQLRASNEWSTRIGAHVHARTSSVGANLPPLAQVSVPIKVRGRVLLESVSCPASGRCVRQRTTMARLPVVVQTKATPGARWAPIGRGTTTSGGHFEVTVVAGLTRPYKVVVPVYSTHGLLVASSTSRPKVTKAVVRIVAAGFAGNVATKKTKEPVVAYASMKPALTGVGMFQAWNRTTRKWINVRRTAVVGGRTAFGFTAPRPGSYVYRFVIPAARVAGTPVLGGITPSMTLSVRP